MQLCATQILFREFSDEDRGVLTKQRTRYISNLPLENAIKNMGIWRFVKRAPDLTEETKTKSIASVFEAILGAIYMDSGITAANKFVKDNLIKDFTAVAEKDTNYKSQLIEIMQAAHKKANFVLFKKSGYDHDPDFYVNIELDGKVIGRGKGKSLKKAEQDAARNALNRKVYKPMLAKII